MLQVCIKAIWVHKGHMHQDMYLFLKLNRGTFCVQNDKNHRNYKHVSRIMKLIHSSTRECHMGSQTPTSWLHHSSFIRSHIIQMLLSLILLYTCRCHFLWAALACSIINLTLAQLTRTVYSSLTAAERRVDLISNSARPSCWPACGPRDLITFLTIGPPDLRVIL